MNIYPHILNASGKLTAIKPQIEKVTKTTIQTVTNLIPVKNVDIIYYDNPTGTITHTGIGGNTITTNLIMISLDPTFPHFKKSLQQNLSSTIAHELYHCLRNYSFAQTYTLLESLINEGLADHFDNEVTGKPPQKWNTALDKNQLEELIKRAKKEFNNKSYNHNAWFFGSEIDKIPQWAGYTIGFNMVKKIFRRTSKYKTLGLI
jgi:uncharacterized protein YjaZ